MTRRTELRIALAVVAAGLIIRVPFSFLVVPAWERQAGLSSTPDQYPELARSLIERGTLGFLEGAPERTTARGPGFPLWLVPGLLAGGDDPRWLGLWAGLPGIAAAGWVAAAAARRFGRLGGLAAGAIAACHPLVLLVSSRVMGDEFYAALGWGAIAAWVASLASEEAGAPGASRAWSLACGALLGWQILTRTNGLVTLAAIVAVAFAARQRGRRTAARLAMVACLALLPALVWSVRSSLLEGRPVFVHSLFWYNFWLGEAIDRVGSAGDRGELAEARQKMIGEAAGMPELGDRHFWWGTLTPEQTARAERGLRAAAVGRILEDPLHYLGRCALGTIHFWIRAETRARTLQYAPLVAPVMILAAAGAHGLLRAGAAGDRLARVALVVVAAHCLVYAMVVPMARASVQVYPQVALLAGAGAARLLRPRA